MTVAVPDTISTRAPKSVKTPLALAFGESTVKTGMGGGLMILQSVAVEVPRGAAAVHLGVAQGGHHNQKKACWPTLLPASAAVTV